ncbi:DNA protecting protein DprA [Salinibacter sp. 10B]|uniref:DNA-processing protein DprA n=1 Tax=Salinibacter sp. 10B TaxID=1923971 RepID=UPI000CF550DF|nr:DNA-processing protein DprA [Salinibacter sp. 10B]PQJ35666.1 DNA protecting protein DprA [Salinibacter sp. 10B]
MRLPLDSDDPSPDLDTSQEQRALIGLSLVPGVGATRLRALLAHFEAPSAVFRASRSALERVDGVGPQTAEAILTFEDRAAVEQEMGRADDLEATLISPWDDRFPDRLREIYDPPAFLWMRGTLPEEAAPMVTVVGTRRCTDYGRAQAHHLAGALARRGFTVVSGLAYGIDAAAHKGALDAGGRTLAVLGSGVGCIYPPKHTSLAKRIAESGAVLSEYAIDAEPDAPNFPERNRILSGLALGTLVVESYAEGGALITARLALEQNREVFALPGNVTKDSSLGTNRLIQQGHAKLVMEIEDLLEELPDLTVETAEDVDADMVASGTRPDPAEELEGPEQVLYDALSDTPMHVDALCEETGLDPSTALVSLLELEFKGLVRQLAGKQFRRA